MGSALLSPCGTYRYSLNRSWGHGATVLFVMLNPSVADGSRDDPTIRRCVGFAKAWGFGALSVANLFAMRSTDPSVLLSAPDPVGPDNDAVIFELARRASLVVAAWGAHKAGACRVADVRRLLPKPVCLGLTSSGHPRHPLYAPGSAPPVALPG